MKRSTGSRLLRVMVGLGITIGPLTSPAEEAVELFKGRDLSGWTVWVGAHCKEGPAVSRTQMKIAWAVNQGLDLADIAYTADGRPMLTNRVTQPREVQGSSTNTMSLNK